MGFHLLMPFRHWTQINILCDKLRKVGSHSIHWIMRQREFSERLQIPILSEINIFLNLMKKYGCWYPPSGGEIGLMTQRVISVRRARPDELKLYEQGFGRN